MQVSLILTVYNEGPNIERLLVSLLQQTRPPDEIVICDGGSTDDTVARIEQFRQQYVTQLPPLTLVIRPGANISQGRNAAIAQAQGPIIAVTDAGVRLALDWLEQLVAPWANQSEPPIAVAGAFLPDAAGVFTTAMAATVLPQREEINPQTFLPSSRSVAFTKAAWQQAGGYPEWLDYCEDLLFDFAINAQRPQQSSAFVWAPKAVVYFEPRTNLRSFALQYFRYARGDGKADLWRKRHLIRYGTYLVALPALLGHAYMGFFARWLGWLGLAAGVIFYCARPWQRLLRLDQSLTPLQWIAAALLVPVIRVVGDVAKMVGYPIGRWWRWRNRHRSELRWRQ